MMKQYQLMVFPRPQVSFIIKTIISITALSQEQLISDVGSLTRQFGPPAAAENDSPPDDLRAEERPPPQYDACMLQLRIDDGNETNQTTQAVPIMILYTCWFQ